MKRKKIIIIIVLICSDYIVMFKKRLDCIIVSLAKVLV